MQIDFNYIGCYRSIGKQNRFKKSEFSIEIGAQAPYLRDHLVPETLNIVKQLLPHEILDLTPRQNEIYIDDGAGEKMETILQFIQQMDSNEKNLRERLGCDIVCGRGLLVRLAVDKNVSLRAVRRKDVIFMCVVELKVWRNHWSRNLSTKFVKQITDDPYYMKVSNNMRILRTGILTKVVNQIKFPKVTVFSSAEVDSRDCKGNIIELKSTNRSRFDEQLKERRIKDFLQCYLSNTEHILTGYLRKNEDQKIEIYELEMIHRDSLIENNQDVEKAMQRLTDHLLELKTLLSKNNRAVLVTGFNDDGLISKSYRAGYCEFLPKEFLSQFD